MSEEKKENKYLVLITGRNTHFEIPVNNIKDFNDLQNILEILKRKL
ncbi:MAG: hypothetical protein PHQ66_02620 [Candidatus Nanoarchaeia archaeon]|nr:hypothetical protein [Candidatus Nanoarchaeia archaeon]MDD5357739.1 hypothetical protein [Candidatus Nanoarchaeia archaeon]MDD5588658.1 hypothetical protein [Candidatus Nanoarchaeia archaeon]